MTRNPAKLTGPNRRPAPRGVRPFARDELEAIAVELSPMYQPIPPSPPPQACDRRSGRRWSAATSTVRAG
jgi:hypothetical protein